MLNGFWYLHILYQVQEEDTEKEHDGGPQLYGEYEEANTAAGAAVHNRVEEVLSAVEGIRRKYNMSTSIAEEEDEDSEEDEDEAAAPSLHGEYEETTMPKSKKGLPRARSKYDITPNKGKSTK
jgi:hypothetical protein